MTLWAALVILVGFSAFFSASETAFSSLNQIRLKSRAEDGDSSAARVLAMAEQYDKLLSTILIGNNIVNIAAASIGTILFTQMLGAERGATVSTIVLTIIVLIFGEVTPKSLAKEMPEKVATAVSPFLVLLMALMTPLTWLFTQWKKLLGHFVHSGEADTITEGELMTMVSEAENDGELTDRESELIRSAIEFDDVEVEEILTPRVDVIAVEDDMPLEEVAQTFAESGYSRLPVYHDTIDNIIGVVHEKDFYMARLKKETKLEDLVKPTLYTTGSTQISQLLRTLREQHHHLAVVVDEYGGTEGIITLEDILEEPFFLTEKNANYRQALDQQLALKKQALSPVLEISDTAFIIRMLEKNHGLSFLPYLAVERDIRKGRIALLHVEDVEISMYRQIFYHKNKFKTREMEEFIRLAAE